MPVPAYQCASLTPGDRLWVSLAPGRDPICVTLVQVTLFRDDAGHIQYATLHVRTTMGHVIAIMHTDILRRAT